MLLGSRSEEGSSPHRAVICRFIIVLMLPVSPPRKPPRSHPARLFCPANRSQLEKERSRALHRVAMRCLGSPRLAPPSPDMTTPMAALHDNRSSHDAYLEVMAGTVAVPAVFSPETSTRSAPLSKAA